MVSLNGGNTLAVVTDTGDVYGADVTGHGILSPTVYHFTGAKIGYNVTDRFMVDLAP
jgi:hypothetical protein